MKNYITLALRVLFITLMLIPIVLTFLFSVAMVQKIICEKQSLSYISPPKIVPFIWHDTGLITIWFDDAYVSQASPRVLQLMDQYGFKAAISVPTYYVCIPGHLGWKQLQILQEKGWEITSHGVNHNCESYLYDKESALEELEESKKKLENKGLRVNHFVSPCGLNETLVPELWMLSKQYYVSYRAGREKINPLPIQDPYLLGSFTISAKTRNETIQTWIHATQEQKGWLILVFHEIKPDQDPYALSLKQFSEILSLIKESGLPVVLPNQVLQVSGIIKP